MTAEPVRFYFDFSSPYGHIAAFVIDDLARRHGRIVEWKPILLGAVFKVTGSQPLLNVPMKQDYARRDLIRSAGFMGVEFAGLPEPFPFSGVAPARAFYWLDEYDPGKAHTLAKALFRAAFVEQRDISGVANVVAVAEQVGLDGKAVTAALQEGSVKARLRDEVDAAIAAGVFGSPFFMVGSEPFWGVDRLPQLEKWLVTGGW